MLCNILYVFLLSLFIVACSDDEAAQPKHEGLKLRVPIEWVPAGALPSAGATPVLNRLGDPGMNDECPAPKWLYVFSWLRTHREAEESRDLYEYCFVEREITSEAEWILVDAGTSSARYQLNKPVELHFSSPTIATYASDSKTTIGRTYAIASGKALSNEQLRSIIGESYAQVLTQSPGVVVYGKSAGEAIDSKVQGSRISVAGWTSEHLRDLYSSPARSDGRLDLNGITNGDIVIEKKTTGTGSAARETVRVINGAVRLYHVAAKIDFQWEVAEALRPTTAIQSITVSQLPEQCSIFKPTENPAGTATFLIGKDNAECPINPGNKWIGRQSFYALQPPGGKLVYSVAFEGTRQAIKDAEFTPSSRHEVFTGWYRIPALVN